MDASTLPKGKSAESNPGKSHLPGIYQHKDTKGTFITADGEAGYIQADALMSPVWKDAWERIGDVPTRLELLEIRKQQAIKDAKEEAALKKAEKAEIEAAVAEPEEQELPAKPAPGTGFNVPAKAVK